MSGWRNLAGRSTAIARSFSNIGEKPFIANPDAANVYLLDFSGLRGKENNGRIMNSGLDAAKWLLNDASVGTVPGECFLFDEKEMLVRIALNHSPQEITLAFDNAIFAAKKIQNPPQITTKPIDVTRFAESNLEREGR